MRFSALFGWSACIFSTGATTCLRESVEAHKPIVNIMDEKSITFSKLDKYVQDTYSPPEKNDSMICDIMAMYLMGQKILYTESKTYCEMRLNYLMLPAIFITSLCSILSLVLKDLSYGSTIVSSFNGINVFLLTLINYLKLDAKAESHRISAYKFDKLQAGLVFQSGKILLLKDPEMNTLSQIIKQIETNVQEIKETNQFILPEPIRFKFPNLYTLNIFAEVKRILNKEMMCINELLDTINKIKKEEDPCLKHTYETHRKLLTDKFISIQTEYIDINTMFKDELERYHAKHLKRRCHLCEWLKT